ncbi:MAG TPA: PilX N-terminal domain-containing pilus assembly protein [Gemmatimonadota bacterium]
MTSVLRGSRRGIALPLALLLLICLGLIGTAAVFLSNSDQRISSGFSRSNNAVAAAEAALEHGIAELTTRAQAGQDPDSVQILSDSLGRFAYSVTVYSKREATSGTSGVDFNGDGDMNDVVRYAQSFGYAQANATGAAGDPGYPVKLVVATASDGTSNAEVRAEVARNRLNANIDGPLALNTAANATVTGSFSVDGRLYDRNGNLVPSGSLNPPYGNTAASKAAAKSDCNYWKSGIKVPAEGALGLAGSMESYGHTSFDHGSVTDQNYDDEDSLSTFKFSPEEVLGVGSGQLDQFKKPASAVPDFQYLSGVNYVTSGTVPSQIGGSGILIVHNPNFDPTKYDCSHFPSTCVPGYSNDSNNQPMTLKINANGNFKGIVITDNLIRLNGNFTMLGGIVSLATDVSNIPANGSGYVRWSCEVVQDVVAQATGYDTRLSWEHRLP